MFLCNTPDLLVSIGSDLRMRSHHRSVGLPTLHSVSPPGTAPSGLAWDGRSVWSVDTETGLLYRHGEDLRVLETRKSLLPRPVGLASEGENIWVVGGEPLQAACLVRMGQGHIWQGPFSVHNLLAEGVLPSGIAVGFERMWAVSGGDPRMVSMPLDRIRQSRVFPGRKK